MKTSIYISGEQIQVIGHNAQKVQQYESFPLPEGTMFNGTIIDHAFLTECLASMKAQHPGLFSGGISLVIDGSSVLSRRIVTPKLKAKQYLQLVRDDFADSAENTDDLVCSFHKLNQEGSIIFGGAVHKNLIDSYTAAFGNAGIKLDSVHMGAELILNFVKSRPELQSSTIVLNVIDGLTMLSMLFENGNNIFMSRSRLYGDIKEQVFSNVLENLNGLIQFTRSQKFSEITKSYYLGISEADLRTLEALNPYSSIQLGTLSAYPTAGTLPPETHFAALNMMHGDEGSNLLTARNQLDRYIRKKKPKKLWIPFMILYIIALSAPAIYFGWQIIGTQVQIAELEAYVNSPAIAQRLEELDAISRETNNLRTIERQLEDKFAYEDSIAKATSEMLDRIILLHGERVSVVSFEFNEATGVVRINARCADATVTADYVDALYRIGVARSVDYKGYGSDSQGIFSFSIDITLNTEEVQ